MNMISYATVVADLEAHPTKRIFWRSGWAYRGAGEAEVSRRETDYPRTRTVYIDNRPGVRTMGSWKDELKAKFDWACAVVCDRNDEDEIHLNGLSCLDME